MKGRRRLFSDEQLSEARRRYELGKANTPAAIAADFGVRVGTLRAMMMRNYRTPYRP